MTRIMLLLAIVTGALVATPTSACVSGFSQRTLQIHLANVRVDPFGLVTRGDRGSSFLRLSSETTDEEDNGRCGALLRVTPIGGPHFGITNGRGANLDLELTTDAQAGTPSIRQPGALVFMLSRQDTTLDAAILEGLATGSGPFEGAFRIELTTADESDVVDIAELTVTTVIPPAVSIRFDDAMGASRKMLDFGHMTSGDMRHLTLHIASTTAYTVVVSSENGGTMVNREAGVRADVAYDLLLGGRAVALGQTPTELARGAPPPGSPARQSLDMAVVLREIAGYAGRYQDTVTFTVSSIY